MSLQVFFSVDFELSPQPFDSALVLRPENDPAALVPSAPLLYEEPRQIGNGENMRDKNDKTIWGHVEKFGEGTRANYDSDKKIMAFCFNRDPQTSSGPLKTLRELLIKELN